MVTARLVPKPVTDLSGQLHRVDNIPPLLSSNAITYQANLNTNEQTVAIRVSRFVIPVDRVAVERIAREVRILALLKHDNIIPLLGTVTDCEPVVSMVTPWRELNAHEYVQDRDTDPRPVVRGIANGLRYLHTHEFGPIFHGNLNGQNILISANGQPQIVDFSCAYTQYVAPAAVRGMVRWMAPEQIDKENVLATAAGDVWSFAMTALELFTKRPPFYPIRSTQGVIIRIMQGPPDRPSDEPTFFRMSEAWWDICLECWKVDPGSRPQISNIIDKMEGMLQVE